MSDDLRMADVRKRLLQPTSVKDVRDTLSILDEIYAPPKSAMPAHEELVRAFQCLRQFTAAEHDQAVEILIDDLLPRCLTRDAVDDKWYGYRLSHTFGEWLDELPEEHRARVRDYALPRTVAALHGDGVRNAIRLISCTGYWDEAVIHALDQIAFGRDDEIGDHALSARVALKSSFPEPTVRETFLQKLHARIPAGPNVHQILAASEIGTCETARLVWTHWLAPRTLREKFDQNLLAWQAPSLFAEIAVRERDPEFTLQVWNWLLDYSQRENEGVELVFSPNSSVVNRLGLPQAVTELIERSKRAEEHLRYIYYLRVTECERPSHMAGWDAVSLDDLATAQADAAASTGMKGRSATIELHRKEAAWEVLLCRGDPSILPSFEDVLASEGGYVAHKFLDLAACLRLDPLPDIVGVILAGSSNKVGWDENQRLVAQIGAIDAAHGSGTREAFDALLGFRQLGEGVLLSLVKALAETALIILEEGDRSPKEELLLIAESAPREDSRGAAAAAVAALLEENVLSPQETTRAAALLQLPGTDPYARRELLFALATRPASDVPVAAVEYAKKVLISLETERTPDLGHSALALVAGQPDTRSSPEFLALHLGLTVDEKSPIASAKTFRGIAPHLVGRYFVDEPERFGQIVASLIRDGDVSAIAHVLPWVRKMADRNPSVVLDALVTRLHAADSGQVAEPAVLQTLATVAPARLLMNGCQNIAAWLPQARADLADTVATLGHLPEELAAARFDLLTRLAGDGIYAVRRAAYRAAALSDSDKFIGLARSWAEWREPGRQGPRRYAAECAGWLPPEVVAEHLAGLGWDQEPAVRESYRRSLNERDNRLVAVEFEERVLGVRDPAAVIRMWRYGVALSHVGDDSTIRRLAAPPDDHLHPSIRFWRKRVRKAVERRWSGETRKWPEPWFARPGRLEVFSGVLRGEAGWETALEGTLWLLPAESPTGTSSWGGWARNSNACNGDGELLIAGRAPAQILVTTTLLPSLELVFSGNGPYPGPT